MVYAIKPVHQRRTQLFLLVLILTNSVGNVALSHGVRIVTPVTPGYSHPINVWTVVGVAMLAVWMLTDLAVLSRADLTYVLPVAASSNVLIAAAGHFWLHEHISAVRWLGIFIISVGVFVAETTPDLTIRPDSEQH